MHANEHKFEVVMEENLSHFPIPGQGVLQARGDGDDGVGSMVVNAGQSLEARSVAVNRHLSEDGRIGRNAPAKIFLAQRQAQRL